MKFIILACILGLVASRPEKSYETNDLERSVSSDDHDFFKIVRDDRVSPGEDGHYSFDFETENGIVRSESGSQLDIEENPIGQQGSYAFDLPNGERFELKFVANEFGFQPESSWIPVAPEFPHPIPQFVLDQIEKAAREDEEAKKAAPYEQKE